MSTYQYAVTIASATPVVVTPSGVTTSSLAEAKFHTIQCTGDACVVDVKIGNNAAYTNVDTLDDAIQNINAYGITAIKLTVASGTCAVSIAGTSE
tara:strand:- start:55 stop:339 length:285 start_codon:yes stop_codon:yes gene_type:complete